jgi:hypothetical protein
MNRREASAMLERLMIADEGTDRYKLGLTLAKQALDILVTLEERLHLREPVTIEKLSMLNDVWTTKRGERTHIGSDLADSLGQLCQVLEMDGDSNEPR